MYYECVTNTLVTRIKTVAVFTLKDALSVKTDNKSMAVFRLRKHKQTNSKIFAQVRLKVGKH